MALRAADLEVQRGRGLGAARGLYAHLGGGDLGAGLQEVLGLQRLGRDLVADVAMTGDAGRLLDVLRMREAVRRLLGADVTVALQTALVRTFTSAPGNLGSPVTWMSSSLAAVTLWVTWSTVPGSTWQSTQS